MANNIIDKIQISGQSYDVKDSSAATVVELTQQEYDNLPSSAKTGNTLFVITDAQAGDLTQYWTSAQTQSAITQSVSGKANSSDVYLKTETSGATEISTALNGKQDTLVSSVNIKTINNTSLLGSGNIDIQGGGGGKAIEAGRGISITTGETADTISFNLPISAGTGTNSIKENYINNIASGAYSHVEGSNSTASGERSHAEGYYSTASGSYSHTEGQNCYARKISSHAEGTNTDAKENYSHTEGFYTIANNQSEHASGQYNVSSKASTTFGDSGNTLFSVGNGTSTSARHNAFEIRQNGDIYLSSGGTDIKLQDHLGGGGGSITIDPSLDSGSTNAVANSAITEAVLVPSHTGLIEVENNVAFQDTTSLYVAAVTGGTYTDISVIKVYLSGNTDQEENISISSFSGHTFDSEPNYVNYQWLEDDSLILTPKTSGNYFYMAANLWDTGFGIYTIDNYSSGTSSSVIQNEIYPRIDNLTEKINNFKDTKITGVTYNNLYNDYGGYWYHEIKLYDNTGGQYSTESLLRYNDFGLDDGVITVKKTSGATSGSTDCITSGGVYQQMGGMKIVKLSQSAYDALSPNYDSNTIYFIVN